MRADKVLQDRIFKNDKIDILWNHTLQAVKGQEDPSLKVQNADLHDIKNDQIINMKVDGIFIAIGHQPNTNIFKGHVDMDNEGYLICNPGGCNTSVPGIFAAGDVQDKIYRQAVTAAGQGCMAALDAEKYLSSMDED